MTAPELIGDSWLGTGGRRLSLSDLRGRVVLLDFWTLCCVNCHHVLAELRPLEGEFADVLTVIGVHSPKFEHEKQPSAVAAALARHGIEHPVINDPDMHTWRSYGVRAWPTLVLIDPAGKIAATYSGEGHAHALEVAITDLVHKAETDGTLRRGPGVFQQETLDNQPYRQPGKASMVSGRLLISDTGNHQLAWAELSSPNAPTLRIGTGTRGHHDGPAELAQFNEPYGHALLPPALAAEVGYDVVIADTGNHVLRGLRLADNHISTIAGTGDQWMQGDATNGPARAIRLSTPWDVTWAGERVYIAMAGDHRIWWFEPRTQQLGVWAGTTHEGLTDGALTEAWFAQPSALAPGTDRIWLIDAETSALRWFDDQQVHTEIGTGLFDFGHRDGAAAQALLQHPLGVAVNNDETVLIADSYNGAIRHFDPLTHEVSTVARDLAEPSDVLVLPDELAILVVESAAGRITKVPVAQRSAVSGPAQRTIRPPLIVAPGQVQLEVVFQPPTGQKQDDRFGPSTQLTVDASAPDLLLDGAGTTTSLTRALQIGIAEPGVLHIAAKAASCDIITDDEQHAACHMHQQDWGIPIEVSEQGTSHIRLVLAGH